MKTSSAPFIAAFSFVIVLLVNVNTAKGQDCGISVEKVTLNFSADPGGRDTQKVTITNTSTKTINLWITRIGSTPFQVIDSDRTIQPGLTVTARVFFSPALTASGLITGMLRIMNASTRCTDTVFLNGIVKTNLCLEAEHEVSYVDPVIIGGSAEHEFRLINQSGAPITITDAVLDDPNNSGFQITSSFPLTVPPHSNDHFLTYSFSPQTDFSGMYFSTTFCTIHETGDSTGCPFIEELLIGNVAKPGGGSGIDTTIRGLFPGENRTLAAAGTGSTVNFQYSFRNNLNIPVTVKNVYMKYGTYFSVAGTNPHPLPFVLNQDQDMTVTVNFTSSDNLLHIDSLLIDAEHNLQTISFAIEGKQTPANSVGNTPLPDGIQISLSPNPTSRTIKAEISGIRSARIEVFDLLGKSIISAKTDGLWVWDSANNSEGSYIVRMAGESLNGNPFVASKQILVRK